MTSHRSHGCRPPARRHNRAPVYVCTYVRTYVCQPSANRPTFFVCIYVYTPRMTERMVAANRASRDAISDCSALRDQSCCDYDSNDRMRLLFNVRLEFVLSAIRISAYYIYIRCIGIFFRIHFSPFFYLFKIVYLGF